MKHVTAVDLAVEAVFGLAAGAALYCWLAGHAFPAWRIDPFLLLGPGFGLCQASADLLRGRGWRYALSCAGAFAAAAYVGGFAAMIIAVLWRLLS